MANFFQQTVVDVGIHQMKKRVSTEVVRDYHPPVRSFFQGTPDDLPLFRLHHAMQMMRDPTVKIGMGIRDAFLSAADVEFETKNPQLGEWLRKQWVRIWDNNWVKITQAKQWGYQGLEIVWETDPVTRLLRVERVKDFAPFDTRPLVFGGEVVGLSVNRHGHGESRPKLLNPQALWLTFDARWQRKYGTSILHWAYGPWWEKWMRHGSKKILQQRMIKDAYMGLVGWAPRDELITLESGRQISARDMMREVLENLLTGASVTLPFSTDNDGNKEYDITRLPDAGDPSGIFQWGDGLNKEIWFALGIAPEVIEAASTGSGFSGRSVPLIATLQMVAAEFLQYMGEIDRQVLRPAAHLNFGAGADYEIKPVDLVETFTAKMGGSQMGGSAIGGPQQGQIADGSGQRMLPPPTGRQRTPGEQSQPEGGQDIESLSDSGLQSIIQNSSDRQRVEKATQILNARRGDTSNR